jgi:translation elongation factor EF-Tu-like GTPase
MATMVARSQSWGDSTIMKGPVFFSAEEAPKFPGGLKGFYQFIAANIEYPENRFSIKSFDKTVNTLVAIDKTGKVIFGRIEKGINENYNKKILELISKMPDWMPAKQNGNNVPYAIYLPFVFVDE